MPPLPSRPEFFIDRSLARRDVAEALRFAGCDVHTHLEVYGERDESVPDTEWLELCGHRGWVVLTMDRRIRWRPTEIATVRRYNVKLFALTSGNLSAAEQARRFIQHIEAIEVACESAAPFVYAVRADGIVRIFP